MARKAAPGPDRLDQSWTARLYLEVSREVAFTIEYSARTAWEAMRVLVWGGPAPPPVRQGQYDP